MGSGRKKPVKVLDTNVLIHDPYSFEQYGPDCAVVIPSVVIQELDNKKSGSNGVGWSSREATRRISFYRRLGSLKKGVKMRSGGILYVDINRYSLDSIDAELAHTNDSKILAVAINWQEKGYDTSLVTKDENLAIIADSNGIKVEDYEFDKVLTNLDDAYTGITTIELPIYQADLLTQLYNESGKGILPYAALQEHIKQEIYPNQCLFIRCENDKYGLACYDKKQNVFRRVTKPKKSNSKLGPINEEQALAWDLLLNNEVKIVTLVGGAGTGKTLLALMAGDKFMDMGFRLVIFRPTTQVGEDLGYLPGSKDDKFRPFMDAIQDNYEVVYNHKCNGDPRNFTFSVVDYIKERIDKGEMEVGPINFIRGRTVRRSFIILDEGQNMTPHEIKTIISRVGPESRIVITGDPTQIDRHCLDSLSNGLTYVVERFKDEILPGHVTLTKGERSDVANLAARKL